jgi:hypothetical protein
VCSGLGDGRYGLVYEAAGPVEGEELNRYGSDGQRYRLSLGEQAAYYRSV